MSKPKRLKLTGPSIRTKTDAEQAMADLRTLHLQLAQANLDRENEIKSLDERFQNAAVMLQARMDCLVQSLGQWAADNLEEFGKQKSLSLTHGKIGWHINPPAVKQLSGWKVEDTIKTMQESALLSKKYIRLTPTLNKEAIIADRENILPETLRACGIRIAQDEPFYAEPKIEEVTPQ